MLHTGLSAQSMPLYWHLFLLVLEQAGTQGSATHSFSDGDTDWAHSQSLLHTPMARLRGAGSGHQQAFAGL